MPQFLYSQMSQSNLVQISLLFCLSFSKKKSENMGSKPLYQNYMLQINFSIFANISIKHVKIHTKNQMPILIFIIIEYKSPLEFHYKIHNHSINPHILLIVMSFLTLRQQIDNWTLQEDDQFFNTVKALSDAIFESEKQITENISQTKYSLHQSQVNLGFGFNQFLKVSEVKFTENKIQEKTFEEPEKPAEQAKPEGKSRLQVMKEALSIGLKNLEIKQEQGDKDNMSVVTVSEYSFSMSTAVFKNTRLPPLFGTKQFVSKPYLNLYTEEDANEINQYRRSMSASHIVPDNISRADNPDFLPPPPPLESVLKPAEDVGNIGGGIPDIPRLSQILGTSSKPADQRRIVPTNIPPQTQIDFSAPPPPPPLLNLPPPPPPPPLTESFISTRSNNEQPKFNLSASFTERPVVYQSQQVNQPPKSHIKKALSFQEQLALRLQKGKNYKEFQTIDQEEHQQPSKIEQPPGRRPTDSQNAIPNFLPPPQTQPPRQDPPLRESVSYKEIVNLTANRFGASQAVGAMDDEEQEQQNSIFKKTKTKKKEEKPQTPVSVQQAKKKNQQDEQFMKRTTFVDGNLFKKKNTMADVILSKKNEPQKKNLFDQDSDEEDKVTLSKPVKKTVQNNESPKVEVKPQPPIIQNKPANPLGGSKISTSPLDIKPIIPKVQPKQQTPPPVDQKKVAPTPVPKPKPAVPAAKTKGGLFQDDQQDDFFKKKKQQKPKEAPKKPTPPASTKKNLLLGDDSDDDFFKKKPLPKLPQNQSPKNQQKQSPLKAEPKKEEAVIKPEPVVVVEQKPRPSEKSIIQVQPVQIKRSQQIITRQPQPSISKTSQIGDLAVRGPQKKKASNKMKMFDDEDDDDFMAKKTPQKVQPPKQEPRKIQKSQPQIITSNLSRFSQQNEPTVDSPVKKDPKRIPGLMMGMGMGPLIPTGMVLTKPSEVKVQQKIALQKLQEQKRSQQQNRLKEIENQKRKAQQHEQQQAIRLENQRKQRQERERQQQEQIYRLQQQRERQRRQDQQRQRQRIQRQQNENKLAQQREYEQRQKAEKRRRQQEQRERMQREQEQEQRRLADQQRRQQQQQLRQQRQRLRTQEEQRLRRQKKEAQQRARYEQLQREQNQRRQREENERQYRAQRQRQQKAERERKQKEQQQRRQRQEYQKQLRQKWEYQQKQKMILQQERLQRERQQLLRIKQQNERIERQRREIQQRQRQEKLAAEKKNQLVPKLPQKGPSPLPQLPTQTSQQAKKTGKKTLFDEEDDEKPLVPEKKVQKKPLPAKTGGKGGLFDDDGDQDFTFKPKAKAPVQKKQKKKNLFDDEDDVSIPSKPQPKKQQKVIPKQAPKEQQKKKNLFDDQDEGFTVPIKKQPSNPVPPPQNIAQPPKKAGLFGDDDSPKIPKKSKQEPKPAQIPVKAEPPKKKGLFDDDDEGGNKKIQPKPPAPKIVEKPVIVQQPKKKTLFDDDEQEIKPAKKIESPPKKQEVSAPANTKKTTLFDEQDEESFKRKKETSMKQPVRQVKPVSQPPAKNNPIKQEKAPSKSPLPSKPQASNKKGLFDDEEEDIKFTAKAPPSKPAPPKIQQSSPTKKKNIFDDQEQDASFVPKKPVPKAEEKPAAKKNLFDGDQQDFSIKKAAPKPSAKNKKKLFDDSD